MKHLTAIIAFTLLSFNISAQDTDLITGKWVFSEVLNERIDEASMAYLKAEVIDKWQFHFYPNGTFETSMMEGQSDGTWKHDADLQTITITDKMGGTQEFKIIRSTKEELALNLGTGKFLLKRIE